MKKILTGLLLVIVLAACSSSTASSSNSIFTVVANEKINGYALATIKHRDTGCFYALSKGETPVLLVNPDGTPYCPKN